MTMTRHAKWAVFWLLVCGFAAGVFVICALVTVVNWAGSTPFCSTFCHSMNGVAYAWMQGKHARTPTGVTAGCSDCHLYNASLPTIGPLQYVSLLGHKVVAASHSFFGQVIGHYATPKLWVEERPGIEKQEIEWFISTNFHTCRGCHDLTKMYSAKNPSIGAWHAVYQNQPLNCVSCHLGVGHNYKNVDAYIKDAGVYPLIESAWGVSKIPPQDVSGASPMPPLNPTPAQLKADATSSASPAKKKASSNTSASKPAAATPAPMTTQQAEQDALKLNKEITAPGKAITAPATAPAPAASATSAASKPAADPTKPAPEQKPAATSAASKAAGVK